MLRQTKKLSALLRKFAVQKKSLNTTLFSTSHSVQSSTTNAETDDKIYSIDEVKEIVKGMVGTRMVGTRMGGAHTEWGSNKIIAPGGVLQHTAKSQKDLPGRKPSDSYTQAIIPIGRDERVRDRYLTFKKMIRYGRILEAFDAFGVLICYKHNMDPSMGADQKSPYAFVTALVDRMDIHPDKPIDSAKDIYLDGNVTWVGRSSMEITMHIHQISVSQNKKIKLLTARFHFVGRNPVTQKAAIVNPLLPTTEEEIRLFQKGAENRNIRLEEKHRSLLRVPPSEEERLLIHDLFLTTVDVHSGTLKGRDNPPNTMWMEDTKYKMLGVCQPEERNLYNKMFGGFLMRKALEMAWTTASLYSKTLYPACKTVDDIVFRRPVEIGALLFMSAQVVYICGPDMQVKVLAEVVNPETGEHKVTNDFYFTFDSGIGNLPHVLPKTYREAMLYVDGKRHYES